MFKKGNKAKKQRNYTKIKVKRITLLGAIEKSSILLLLYIYFFIVLLTLPAATLYDTHRFLKKLRLYGIDQLYLRKVP